MICHICGAPATFTCDECKKSACNTHYRRFTLKWWGENIDREYIVCSVCADEIVRRHKAHYNKKQSEWQAELERQQLLKRQEEERQKRLKEENARLKREEEERLKAKNAQLKREQEARLRIEAEEMRIRSKKLKRRIKISLGILLTIALVIGLLIGYLEISYLRGKKSLAGGDFAGAQNSFQIYSGVFYIYKPEGFQRLLDSYIGEFKRLSQLAEWDAAEQELVELKNLLLNQENSRIISRYYYPYCFYCEEYKYDVHFPILSFYNAEDVDILLEYLALNKAVSQGDWDDAAQMIVTSEDLKGYTFTFNIAEFWGIHPELRQAIRLLEPNFWPPNGQWSGTANLNDGSTSPMTISLIDCDQQVICGMVEFIDWNCEAELGYTSYTFDNGSHEWGLSGIEKPDSCSPYMNFWISDYGTTASGHSDLGVFHADLTPVP